MGTDWGFRGPSLVTYRKYYLSLMSAFKESSRDLNLNSAAKVKRNYPYNGEHSR